MLPSSSECRARSALGTAVRLAPLLLLLLFVLCCCTCVLGLYSEEDNIVLIQDAKSFQKIVHEEPGFVMVVYYKETCKPCQKLAPQYVKVAKSMQGAAVIAAVDCGVPELEKKVCRKSGVPGYPTVKLFGPKIELNPYTKELNKESVTLDGQLAKDLVSPLLDLLTEEHITQVDTEADLASAQKERPDVPRVLLFSEKAASSGYKGVSFAFTHGMQFLSAKDTATEMVEKFSITDFPAVVLIKTDGSTEKYDGSLKAGPLREYLAPHVVEEKSGKAPKKGGEEEKKEEKIQAKSVKEAGELDAEEDMWLLAFHGAGTDCKADLDTFMKVLKDMGNLINVASVAVSEADSKAVDRYGLDLEALGSHPCKLQLVLLPDGEDKDELDDYILYEGPMEAKPLSAFITDNMPALATEIGVMNYNLFMATDPSAGEGMPSAKPGKAPLGGAKVLLFTNKEEVPGLFKALALNNRNLSKTAFGWCLSTVPEHKQILQQLQVAKVPAIKFILPIKLDPSHPEYDASDPEKMGVSLEPYMGPMKYKPINDWVRMVHMIWSANVHGEKPQGGEQKEAPTRKAAQPAGLVQVKDTEEFERACSKAGVCIVGLLDGSDPYQVDSAEIVLKEVAAKSASLPVSFTWVDVFKFRSVLKTFGISRSNVPTVVAYSAKRMRFAPLMGELSIKNVNELVENVIAGHLRTEPLEDAPLLVETSGDDEPEYEAEVIEEEFDLSDIMSEEVEGEFMTAEEKLKRAEEELAAEQAKKAEEAAQKAEEEKEEKKKKKKKKKTKKDEL